MEPHDVHDISGFWPAIHLGAGLDLPTYFLMISLACCIGVLWVVRRAEARALPRNQALDLALILMGTGFVGARLFHIVFEEPRYYLADPWRVIEIWRGGFVWYGGALLGAIACAGHALYRHWPLGRWLDVFAPVCSLGYALGRVACFMTGCCYGAVCTFGGTHWRHPTQLYAILTELATLTLILWLEKRRREPGSAAWLRPDGRIFTIWLVLHSAGRILMEMFRADPRGPEPLGLSIATWISLALIVLALGFSARRPAQ